MREFAIKEGDPAVMDAWGAWIKNCDEQLRILRRLSNRNYHPFKYHEQEASSLLSNAASLAGYPSICESPIRNKSGSWGRVDLWFLAYNIDYYFEFKRCNFDPLRGKWNFNKTLTTVYAQARARSKQRNSRVFAAVIACTDRISCKKRNAYDSFLDDIDMAYLIGPDDNSAVRLYFKEVT